MIYVYVCQNLNLVCEILFKRELMFGVKNQFSINIFPVSLRTFRVSNATEICLEVNATVETSLKWLINPSALNAPVKR